MRAFIPHIVLTLFGLFFIYTGVFSLARPTPFGRMLGLTSEGRSGEIEIRAQYGGFFLAAGISQMAALTGAVDVQTGLIVALIIFGGLIAGRCLSLYAIDGIGCAAAMLALSA